MQRLLSEQFPQWASLPVRRVLDGGNDHRMFRLGDSRCVRLPSGPGYVPQVVKEQVWLPRLATQVPLPIPQVLGRGRPSSLFPAPWSVYGWVDGRRTTSDAVRYDGRFSADLAEFLVALRSADVEGAPAPGLHSGFRGGPMQHWDEMGDLVRRVSGRERDRAGGMWRDALDAAFDGPPVWVHGDTAIATLLVGENRRLSAVLDFGCWRVRPMRAGRAVRRGLRPPPRWWPRAAGQLPRNHTTWGPTARKPASVYGISSSSRQ